MARTLTNSTVLRAAVESSTIGTLPSYPAWRFVEFDTISAYGAVITTVVRRPISQDRGRKKGTVTDLDSTVEFETDLTYELFTFFAEAFMFATFANDDFDLRQTYGTPSIPRAPGVDGTNEQFDVNSISSALAAKIVYGASTAVSLLFSSGYDLGANNGLHAVGAAVSASDTTITVATNLSDEAAPPRNATLEVAGVRLTDGDLTYDFSAGTLTSGGDVDFTVLGLNVGQYIHVGSATAAGVLQNALQRSSSGTEDDTFGYARITAISATVLTLDKLGTAFTADANNTGTGVVDIMFGRFARNVPVTSSEYLERTYQFEATFPTLGGPSTPEYEYAIGNFVNEFTFNLPLTNKATVTFGLIGTNADDITPTVKGTDDEVDTAAVAAAGTGYTDGDTVTASGGTGTNATFTASVTAGAITALTPVNRGRYTVFPTNPVTLTGGTGSGGQATLTSRKIADETTTPLRTTAFNTSTDLLSITTDVTSSASEVCFKSLSLSILNNVSPEKCLGTLGAVFVNAGLFEANLEGQMLFTNKSIVNAIKNNTTVTFAAILRNQDGAIAIDMPEMNLGGGGREYPVDQSVLVNITGASFTSNAFGFDISFSLFACVPGVVAQTA